MEYKVYILRLIDDATPKYVGITSGDLNKRLIKHIHDIKRESCKNKHKKNWLSKYKNSVIIEQIDIAANIDDLKQKEIFYIRKYRDIGIDLVNATDGGDGSYGFKHTEETIEKISGKNNHMYGKKHTAEWIENARKRIPHNKGIKTGIPAWNKGIPCSEEIKDKIRSKKIGKKDTEQTKSKKSKSSKNYLRKLPIEGYINGKWIKYDSSKDASIDLGLNRTKILSVCKGNRKSTGGIFFRYLNSDNMPIPNNKPGRKGNNISIEFGGVINIYDSISDASIKSKIPRETISKIIGGLIVYKYIEYKINTI